MNALRTSLTAIALVAVAALPAAAVTERGTAPQHLHFATTFVPDVGVGEYDGTLDITVSPDGIVNGTYRPDTGNFIPVTGGEDGKSVWLDIGFMGRLHIDGTRTADGITGATMIGDRIYDFTARPAHS